MAEKNNAHCTICGKPYHVCLSCLDSMRLSPWKIHTDTAEHFKISQIVHGVSTNIYTKDEARTKLKNVNLDDIETFRPHIKKIIEDILKEETIVEVVPEVETPVEKTEVVKPTISRKRNYKVNNEVEATE